MRLKKCGRDRHRQLGAGQQDPGAFDVGQVQAEFEVGEGINAISELPAVIIPVSHGIVRPVTGSM